MHIPDGFIEGETATDVCGSISSGVKSRVVSMYALLIGVNAGAWIWALIAFHNHPILLGTALLAYTFGLRHAVDADHIAAIDNVTRKLMQQGKRPVAVGFFCSLGHSTIVFGLSAAIALTSVAIKNRFDSFESSEELSGLPFPLSSFWPSPLPTSSSSFRSIAPFSTSSGEASLWMRTST